MKTLRIYPTSLNERYIDEAVETLRAGSLIIYPTDTLYAIGCDALNQGAIERLCKFKGLNPQKHTLSAICTDISQASEYARIDNKAFKLLKEYCPGPYTFILPAATSLPKAFKGRHAIGIRIPDNPIPRALAHRLEHPMVTTSLPTDDPDNNETIFPGEIASRFDGDSRIALIIDGGNGQTTPSTVVDLTDSTSPQIIREGAGTFNF